LFRTATLLALLFGCSQPNSRTPAPAAPTPAPAAPIPAPPPAEPPAADPALKQKLIAALSGFEHIATKDELDRLAAADALTATLIEIYRDPDIHLAVRTNALASLRFYPSPRTQAALESALLTPETPDVVRRSAVRAYAAGFGQQAVPVLARVLEHPELHTRNMAAKALLQIGGNDAGAALRHRLPNERDPMVKSTIEAGLIRR
jgi:HEAT repeat protein